MKKFRISAETLKTALTKLGNAVSKNSAIPALSNIHCKADGGHVEFTASDMEVTVKCMCNCEASEGALEFLIPFHLINKIVDLNRGRVVEFIQQVKAIKVLVEQDNYDLLTPEKITNFPKLPVLENPQFQSLPDELLDILNSALKTVSKDESRPHLAHVLLEIRKEKTTVVSTEGSYMIFTSSIQSVSSTEGDLLVNEKVIKALEGTSSVMVAWNEKYIVFKTDSIVITITRTEHQYVKYASVFPKNYESNLTLSRSELIRALEKCSINTSPYKHTTIELGTDGIVCLRAKDVDFNIDINVELQGNYKGSCDKITLSAAMLLKLLNQVNYDSVDLAIHEAQKPILLRAKENKGYLSFLMPVANQK